MFTYTHAFTCTYAHILTNTSTQYFRMFPVRKKTQALEKVAQKPGLFPFGDIHGPANSRNNPMKSAVNSRIRSHSTV